jgi:hypothetical protein
MRKALAHACSDEVTAAKHQISSIDSPLDHRCVKLLKPLAMHMQDHQGLWQPRSDNGDELRHVRDMDDVAILQRGVRDHLADELPVPQFRVD